MTCRILLIWSLFLAFAISTLSAAEEIALVEGGKASCQIVLPDSPSPVQQTAAAELQKYFAQISGVTLPIVSETESAKGVKDSNGAKSAKSLKETEGAEELKDAGAGKTVKNRIVIGPSALSRSLLGETLDESKIGYDGIVLKTVGEDLVLTGHPQRGMLYAVYELLQKQFGCGFWTKDCETIPKSETLTVPSDLDVQFTPVLPYREAHYHCANHANFAAKMKNNGALRPVTEEFGGHHEFCHFVHSFYPILPPSKYFKAHPEWYSEVDGKRTYDRAQLCLTNEEMTREFIKNALEDLRERPNATFLSVSQNDWHENCCRCEKCSALAEKEGSQSGPLLHFVNRVAEAVEKEFPHVYVETLAYTYTRKPPKFVKPRKNVVVRLCTIECSFSQPLSGPQNVKLREDIEGWAKIAPRLFVWDYVTNFHFFLLPHPNYYVLKENINFFVDHRTIGLFEQGDNTSKAGDFTELRNWVLSRLLWDPSLDFDQLKDEFVAGYYAPEMVPLFDAYFMLLASEVEKSKIYLRIYRRSVRDWLTFEGLNEAARLLNEAEALARDLEKREPERYAGLVSKIRRARMPMDLAWILDYPLRNLEAGFSTEEFHGPKDYPAAIDDWMARLDEFGITHFKERGGIQILKDELLQKKEVWLKSQTGTETDIPEICRDLPKNSWLEIQESLFSIGRLGECAFCEKDPNASNGLTVRMVSTHRNWSTIWTIPPQLLRKLTCSTGGEESGEEGKDSVRCRIYVSIRCDAKTEKGPAMELGVYDDFQRKNLVHRIASIPAIGGKEYQLIDLGSFEFGPGQYFWAAPMKNPDRVENVFTDRLILIRE